MHVAPVVAAYSEGRGGKSDLSEVAASEHPSVPFDISVFHTNPIQSAYKFMSLRIPVEHMRLDKVYPSILEQCQDM